MKRRSVLQSIVALPAIAIARAGGAQKDLAAVRQHGLAAGPPLVPPGINETPITPVVAADQTADGVNTTFTAEQFSALNKLGDLIVPPWNDCPGATEAGAAEFLSFLAGCSPPSRIDLYRNGLDALNREAQTKFGKNFAALTASEADPLLSPLRETSIRDGDILGSFLSTAKADLLQATFNSRPYIDALSQVRRPRNASRFYWYPIN